MNYDLIFALIFYFIIYGLFIKYRSRFEVQNKLFIMYKTQLGISWMEKIAHRFPRLLHILSYVSIFTGFLGMSFIFYVLFKGTFNLITVPSSQPVVAPILPGVAVPGAPTLSFWHWIIGILLVAVVHEFMHGVYSKRYKVKIKSSGFAFLGPILAAFVEPDDEQLAKASKHNQLAIISAGPFANFLFAGVVLLVLGFILNPLATNLVEYKGVQIASIDPTLPINQTSLTIGSTIDAINDLAIQDPTQFAQVLATYKPGDTIIVTSGKEKVPVRLGTNSQDATKPRMGVGINAAETVLKPPYQKFRLFYPAFIWIGKLFFWLFTISLGVGLFNLLPLGPVDGGKMFMIASLWLTKDDQKKAKQIWMTATIVCLLLILINLLPYFLKLLSFIFSPILLALSSLF